MEKQVSEYDDIPFNVWYKKNLPTHRFAKSNNLSDDEEYKEELFKVYKTTEHEKLPFARWLIKYGEPLRQAKLKREYYGSDEEKNNMKLEYAKYHTDRNKYMRSIIQRNKEDPTYLIKFIDSIYELLRHTPNLLINDILIGDEIGEKLIGSVKLTNTLLHERRKLNLIVKEFEDNSHICASVTDVFDKVKFIANKCGELEHEKCHLEQQINEQQEELEKIREELALVEKAAFERKDRMVVRMKQLQLLIDEI